MIKLSTQVAASSLLLLIGLAFVLLGANQQSRFFGLVCSTIGILEALVLFGVFE
jgi:asparagine N-glycosylation enzyme membrane subunit Stt3